MLSSMLEGTAFSYISLLCLCSFLTLLFHENDLLSLTLSQSNVIGVRCMSHISVSMVSEQPGFSL